MTFLGVVIGTLIAAGLLTIWIGTQPAPERDVTRGRQRTLPAWLHLSRTERTRAIAAFVIALIAALFTGWVVLIAIVPLAAIALPRMFDSSQDKANIEKLEAVDKWTRSLAGVLTGGGLGLGEALASTQRTAPEPIRPAVQNLAARLNSRIPAEQALRAFAHEVDNPAAHLVAGALIMGARETGVGLSATLNALAASVSAEVVKRRDVEAARQGPRQTMRTLTFIVLATLAGFIMFTGFGSFYRHGAGQIVLIFITIAVGACLVWLKRTTSTKPRPGFLSATGAPGTKENQS